MVWGGERVRAEQEKGEAVQGFLGGCFNGFELEGGVWMHLRDFRRVG